MKALRAEPVLRAALGLVFLFVSGTGVSADTQPFLASSGPIAYQHVLRTNPNWSIHIVRIDLSAPGVHVAVARGGPDPDGDGPWTTTLLPTSEIARRENFAVAVNGDFFVVPATNEPGGDLRGYTRGKFARLRGWAMTDGDLWQRAEVRRPYLAITATNTAQLGEAGADEPPNFARQVMGGSPMIVREGRAVAHQGTFARTRHPRTAAGADRSGHQLTLVVVDGRQPDLSVGMTLAELSAEMLRLGCWNALNLDGGGSTTLVFCDPVASTTRVMNSTSDGRERAVANILGIRVEPSAPAVTPPPSPSLPESRHP